MRKNSLNKLFMLVLVALVCFTMAIVMPTMGSVASAADGLKLEGFSIRVEAPDGLRVKASISAEEKAKLSADAQFGMLMLPEAAVNDNLTIDKDGTLGHADIVNIVAKKWSADGTYFNGVLIAEQVEGQAAVAFPERLFNTPISVVAYYIDGESVFLTEVMTRSMAYTAASAYVNGMGNDYIDALVSKTNVELNVLDDGAPCLIVGMPTSAKLTVGGIDASASDKVKVAYASSDDTIATVNATTGEITALKAGSVTITATMSGDSADKTIVKEQTVEVRNIVNTLTTYTFGYKNGDLILDGDDFDGTIETVMTADGTILEGELVDGDYVIAGNKFDKCESINLIVMTDEVIAPATVEVVTAVITSVEDFKKIATEWGSTGTYVLAADLDFKGETYSNANSISSFNFDGKGHSISNVVTSSLFGRTFSSGTIKNVALLNLNIAAANFSSGLVQSVNGGTIENVYVSGGFNGAIAHGGIVSREYLKGKLNNIVVDVLPTNVAGSSVAVITRVNGANATSAIPEGITNVYSMGWTAKHITFPDKIQPQGWDTDTLITAAKGGYADAAAFLLDKANVTFSEAFSFGKDSGNNTVLKLFDKTVKCFYDGDISYTFGYKNQDLILPAEDFDGEVTSIKVNGADVAFTTNTDGDYVIAKSNFTATGVVGLEIKTANSIAYKNVEVITAVLMNKADLDNMDVWGRPSNFDQTKLGTSGYLYTYSGIFYLGADIDYEGGAYSSDCYVGSNGYASGTGAYWKNLIFDGQGYSIKNIHISNGLTSIFGMWLTDSTVKNLAVTNAVIEGVSSTVTNASLICQTLKGTSVLENVFIQGDVQNNGGALSDISFVTLSKDATSTIKNVVVDFKNTSAIGKICGVVNVGGNDVANIVKVENCYTIGSLKNIVYTVPNNGTVDGVTHRWGTWHQVTGSTGGYADDNAFLTDKATIFTGDFANTFKIAEVEGATVLQFYNSALGQFRTVKTFQVAE